MSNRYSQYSLTKKERKRLAKVMKEIAIPLKSTLARPGRKVKSEGS